MTKNFMEHQNRINQLSIVDIKRAYDAYTGLITELKMSAKDEEYAMEEVEELASAIKDLETNVKCPRCGSKLFKSDLPQYEYVCSDCDENFYECEVDD